ncbi:MAG TPA: hypothetical protein PLD02_15630, partial [Saprospiraceae bacterium]|nr:hypothetical protein [Saprospiraceae bacterium]
MINLFRIIREGTKAVPATKYALGVAGIVALVALVVSFNIDLKVAFWGTFILLGLMIILTVFAKLTTTAPEDFRLPVKIIMWAFVI